ncbi:MAG: hypothetical protein GDA67_16715 [Nitrospira sp. CR1.3]|nr:hypothetical protein [Nitrospira sp. CR1.3]
MAVIVAICISSKLANTGYGITLGIILAAWICWSAASNRPVEFERQRLRHFCNRVPSNAIPINWRWWFAAALGGVFASGCSPVIAPVCLLGVMAGALIWQSRPKGLVTLMAEHYGLLFAYQAYPDRRYSGSAGTDAIWFPTESILRRVSHLVAMLLPFYVAWAARMTHLPAGQLGFDGLLSLPLPSLALVIVNATQLQRLQRDTRSELHDNATEWDECARRVSLSKYERGGVALSDHLFVGFVLPPREQAWHPFKRTHRLALPCRTPALVHIDTLDAHIDIEGPTRSGKTAIGQVGILTQLIRPRIERDFDPDGRRRVDANGTPRWRTASPSPLLIIDLKGDPALFNTAREETARTGQTFRYFTLDVNKASAHLSTVTDIMGAKRSPVEACEVTLYMLDLYHGNFYGASYYSERARHFLLSALLSIKSPIESWEALYRALLDKLDPREHRDAFELLGRIYAISQYKVLGPAPPGVDTIVMSRVIENNECVYMWLPALESAMSIVGVGKMALFSFIDAARKFNASGRPVKRAVASIDEAQVITGRSTERVLQQASGAGVSLILSHHSLANLDTPDAPNLGRTIWTNTRVKQAFGILDARERDDWVRLSGETTGYLTSSQWRMDGKGGVAIGETRQQVIHTRLTENAISAVNNTPGSALLYVNGDAGFTRFESVPHEIWCPYPMSLADYRRRSTTPWPNAPELQSREGVQETTVVNDRSPAEVEAAACNDYSALETLFRDVTGQRIRHNGA